VPAGYSPEVIGGGVLVCQRRARRLLLIEAKVDRRKFGRRPVLVLGTGGSSAGVVDRAVKPVLRH
jgi:hypothetical protein